MISKNLKMNDEQIVSYDLELASSEMLDDLFELIEICFGDRPFNHLDIGGGNGRFTGRILKQFTNCTSTLIDSSELLIQRNEPHPRKRVFCTTVQKLNEWLEDETFDFISVNWLLHHLVQDSYRKTRRLQSETMSLIRKRIKPTGCISVYEDMIEGIVSDTLTSWFLYQMTSAKLIAPIVRYFGGTPAGIGVCFQSKKMWHDVFCDAGYEVLHYISYKDFDLNPAKKLFLSIRSMRHALFLRALKEEG